MDLAPVNKIWFKGLHIQLRFYEEGANADMKLFLILLFSF